MSGRFYSVVLLLSFFFVSCIYAWGSDRVKLKDVEAITLYEDKQTNSRRSYPVPHLKCVGGSAGCHKFVPKVVQCHNRGYDGYDVQWECKTEMDSNYKFGRIQVNCEGYDYPDDPYILRGSCGLEYTIDYASGGKSHHHEKNYHSTPKPSMMSNLITFAILAIIIYAIYRTCISNNQYSSTNDDYPDQQNRRNNFFGFGSQSPPPPGFRPDYYPGESCSQNETFGRPQGGGFWTGAATGGILGYLFGSRGQNYGSNYSSGYGSGFSRPTSGWGWGEGTSERSHSPETRTTSGFGGTTRR